MARKIIARILMLIREPHQNHRSVDPMGQSLFKSDDDVNGFLLRYCPLDEFVNLVDCLSGYSVAVFGINSELLRL